MVSLRISICVALFCLGLAGLAVGQNPGPSEWSTQPQPRVISLPDPPTTQTLAVLGEIERRHGGMTTLVAEFDQVKRSAAFDETIESDGRLYIQMPDMLRCEYANPDPSTLWFIRDTYYQVSPAIEQVDQFTYRTESEAREQFRLMLLGFGMSSREILENYEVRLEPDTLDDVDTSVLVFRPIDPRLARVYEEFRVWLGADYLPRKVRYSETSGDVTELTIRRISKDIALRERIFRPEWPRNFEVIQH